MQLIALQEFTYKDQSLKRGDSFEAPELHAKLFMEAGRAKVLRENNLVGKPADLDNRAVKAEDDDAEKAESESRRKRKYMRRDMRPQE